MNGSNPGGPHDGEQRSGSTAVPDVQATMGLVEGTNVVRVPFGVRRPQRSRPARPQRWATVVLPFQGGFDPTPPPQAA